MEHTFKVGDRVRVRQWDDMVKEFGLTLLVDCKTNPSFVTNMKHLCGREATIKDLHSKYGCELLDWSDTSGDMNWSFSTQMLELVSKPRSSASWTRDPDCYRKGSDWYTQKEISFKGKTYSREEFMAFAAEVDTLSRSYRRNFPKK